LSTAGAPEWSKGPQGPAGAPGPSFARGHFRTGSHTLGEEFKTLAELELPKGYHMLHAKLDAYEFEVLGSEVWQIVTCRLRGEKAAGGGAVTLDVARMEVNDETPERAAMSLLGVWWVESGFDDISLECRNSGGLASPPAEVTNVKLLAQEVGGWTAVAN
jgi:hypothetical protein